MDYQLTPIGDQAVMINLSDNLDESIFAKVQSLSSYLENHPFPWMIEYIPAFTSITIIYDPIKIIQTTASIEHLPYEYVQKQLISILSQNLTEKEMKQRTIKIPVCYGGMYGPDLEFIAETNQLTIDEVIDIHSSGDYTVQMLGFAPGFPYIKGMSEKIAAPRKKTPRFKIPARSVGIGGSQTGIYSIETPGGWQIIGRTPLPLFQPEESPPSLLRAGDKIQFVPISEEEFIELERQQHD